MKLDYTKLERAFNPRCVAVVGDKKEYNFMWLRTLSNFSGKVYSVQIDTEAAEKIRAMGIGNYTSLLDIPEPVDLVIVAVPRSAALSVLEDCIVKDVAAAQFFTSGFAETGTEEGIRLQDLLAERARAANFHLVGPNCMGIYSPAVGVRQSTIQDTGFTGPLGFISQSGTIAITFTVEAQPDGVSINKSVSFGNGVILDSPDYLDYFGRDDAIKAIGMYLEGVKDGRRFFNMLKEVAGRKPVVIWKGGQTGAGGRAIASHTGSLARPQPVWEAVVRQAGAVNAATSDELLDTLKSLLYMSPVRGNRLALVGGSGGESVTITDSFVKAGLEVPPLTGKSYDELATFFSLVGAGCRNPIDPGSNWRQLKRILDITERDDNIDCLVVIFVWSAMRMFSREQLNDFMNSVISMKNKTKKPVLAIIPFYAIPEQQQQAREMVTKLKTGGVPVFSTAERAARALKNTMDYYSAKS